MKRINAISIILALSLSLAACGGGGASESESTSGPAETFSYPDFLSEVQANQVRASETYVGNRFAISAFVSELTQGDCTLEFLDSSDYFVTAPLDQEALLDLETGMRIQVDGSIESIDQGWIILDSAEVTGSAFPLSASVLSLVYASASAPLPAYCIARVQGSVDGIENPLCKINLSGEGLSTLAEGDTVSVQGPLYTLSTNPLEGGVMEYLGEKVLLEMRDAQFVENS